MPCLRHGELSARQQRLEAWATTRTGTASCESVGRGQRSLHLNKPIRSRAAREAWRKLQTRCAACWRPVSDPPWLGFSVHHLVRRSRSDEACNLLFLCEQPCHKCCDGEQLVMWSSGWLPTSLPLGAQLTIKAETPDEWNPERLRELRHKESLPELLPIPEWFLQERRRWTR